MVRVAGCRVRGVTEQSAAAAMQSFPPKARRIFRLLVEKQREEGGEGGACVSLSRFHAFQHTSSEFWSEQFCQRQN